MLLNQRANAPFSYWLLCAAVFLLTSRPAHAWVVELPAGVRVNTIASDPKGNVVVGGSRETGPNTASAYVALFRSTGERVWETSLDTPAAGRSEIHAVVLDRKGAVYAVGAQALDEVSSHPVAARLDSATGKRLWWTPLESLAGRAVQEGALESLTLNPAGSPVAAGYAVAEGNPLGIVAALDGTTGTLRWHWSEPGGTVRAVAVDRAGHVGATGPFLAVKLDGTSGAPLWKVDGAAPQSANLGFPQMKSLAFTKDGDLVVGGSLRNVTEDTHAPYAARLNGATGAVRWDRAGQPTYALQTAARLAVDPTGDVLAAGRQADQAVAFRWDARSGETEWQADCWTETAPRETDQFITGLAVDAKCLYVGGTDGEDRFRITVLRRTGQARWRRDLGPGGVSALALCPSGRLYATGKIRSESTGEERWIVAGMRATDGADIKAAPARRGR